MPGKALGVDRGRRDDHLEVAPLGKQALQVAEQKVDVDRTLVRLVDDHRVVGAKHRIVLRLGEQNAVRHQLDGRAGRHRVGEADLVAHDFAGLGLELLGDALRDRACSNASRLRVRDHAVNAAPRHHGDFGKLRRLARTRLAADDHDAIVANSLGHLLAALRHGKTGHEREGRHGVAALLVGEPPGRRARLRLRMCLPLADAFGTPFGRRSAGLRALTGRPAAAAGGLAFGAAG